MIPVDQQVLHDPTKGLFGDCLSAVIASLLNLSVDDVPNFAQITKNDPYDFWEEVQKFCHSKGYVYMASSKENLMISYSEHGDVYHAISGPSPRGVGVNHVVVGKNGRIVHDPHPSRAGLAGSESDWTFAFLVHTSDNR